MLSSGCKRVTALALGLSLAAAAHVALRMHRPSPPCDGFEGPPTCEGGREPTLCSDGTRMWGGVAHHRGAQPGGSSPPPCELGAHPICSAVPKDASPAQAEAQLTCTKLRDACGADDQPQCCAGLQCLPWGNEGRKCQHIHEEDEEAEAATLLPTRRLHEGGRAGGAWGRSGPGVASGASKASSGLDASGNVLPRCSDGSVARMPPGSPPSRVPAAGRGPHGHGVQGHGEQGHHRAGHHRHVAMRGIALAAEASIGLLALTKLLAVCAEQLERRSRSGARGRDAAGVAAKKALAVNSPVLTLTVVSAVPVTGD